ncbi:MAG: hypothetical protein V3V05_09245 [Pontiella sp.]
MTRCKSCLTTAEPLNGLCPVCGIVQETKHKELAPKEKKIRFHARCIRIVAMFHLLSAAMAILVMPEFPAPVPIIIFAVINAFIAYGLVRYSLISYKAATVYYFLIGMVNVLSIQRGSAHLGGVALALIGLYLVGNGTAKAIFERRLPGSI